MNRPTFRSMIAAVAGLVGLGGERTPPQLKAPLAPLHPVSRSFDMKMPDFSRPRPMRARAGHGRMPASWYRFCETRAQWRRQSRDAANAERRKCLLCGDPVPASLQRVKLSKGGRLRARLQYCTAFGCKNAGRAERVVLPEGTAIHVR